MIVSSTSWTDDEDFNIMLDAIIGLDRYLISRSTLNEEANVDISYERDLVIITGIIFEFNFIKYSLYVCLTYTNTVPKEKGN